MSKPAEISYLSLKSHRDKYNLFYREAVFSCRSCSQWAQGCCVLVLSTHSLLQGWEEFLPVIPSKLEATTQDLMTCAVNCTCALTERSLFVEIFFVFTDPNRGSSLSFSFHCNIFLEYAFVCFYFLFVCMFSRRHGRNFQTMYEPGFSLGMGQSSKDRTHWKQPQIQGA